MISDELEAISASAFMNCSSLAEFQIPNSCTTIDYNAFRGCSKLSINNLHSDIIFIGSGAFYGCTEFSAEINLPKISQEQLDNTFSGSKIAKVDSLGSVSKLMYTFQNCTSLESCTLPSSLTYLGRDTFRYSLIKSLIIPASFTTFDHYALRDMALLEYVIMEPTIPPAMSSTYVFDNGSVIYYVPDESLEAYKTASQWSYIAARILPISELPTE